MSVLTMSALVAAGFAPATAKPNKGSAQDYVVLYAAGVSEEAAAAAIKAAGGTITDVNLAVGLATVSTTDSAFLAKVGKQRALAGAARNKPIGKAPALRNKVTEETDAAAAVAADATASSHEASGDPLSHLQWNMDMIDAPRAHKVQDGDKRVLVGVIDTGIDAHHPDIKANFSFKLSRNFTTDIPLVDGPCEDEPDASCSDPSDVDEGGHGTHVASTIGSPRNGTGIVGVAPGVTLVNLRAGQDSGYFFLKPTVDALVYAAKIGVDVANMSYYIDPWLYNCANNPADSPEEQMEQRTIIAATNRALDYAHKHGVTLIAAAGNSHTDLGNPTFDDSSPDFPPGNERERHVDNSCLDMPTEGNHVMSISSIGPSKTKADYSNYGIEQITVAAPGGWFRDGFGTPSFRTFENMILAAWPKAVLLEEGRIDADGNVLDPSVRKDCTGGTCGYYIFIQGTSMAAPHASGVAALIVSEYGRVDRRSRWKRNRTGLRFNPWQTQKILRRTATDTPCPPGGLQSYVREGRDPSFDAVCVGDADFNGFYGDGIVDAYAAVARMRKHRH